MEYLPVVAFLLCAIVAISQGGFTKKENLTLEYREPSSSVQEFSISVVFNGQPNKNEPVRLQVAYSLLPAVQHASGGPASKKVDFVVAETFSMYTVIVHRQRTKSKFTYANYLGLEGGNLIYELRECGSHVVKPTEGYIIRIFTLPDNVGGKHEEMTLKDVHFDIEKSLNTSNTSSEFLFSADNIDSIENDIAKLPCLVKIKNKGSVIPYVKKYYYSLQYLKSVSRKTASGEKKFAVFQIMDEVSKVKDYVTAFVQFVELRIYTLNVTDTTPAISISAGYIRSFKPPNQNTKAVMVSDPSNGLSAIVNDLLQFPAIVELCLPWKKKTTLHYAKYIHLLGKDYQFAVGEVIATSEADFITLLRKK